jgi:heme oxygenase
MDNTGLMEKLKDSTRAMHDSAEGSQFQGRLANGALPRQLYIDYLEQLYLVHSKLEQAIRKTAGDKTKNIVSDDQLQEPFLRQDLESFGKSVQEIKPLSATSKLLSQIDELAKTCPVALLGMHYVLLGSKHGGKFVAKTCQDSYNLVDGKGALYFDPYGPNFMPIWKTFKESMNDLPLEDGEIDKVCSAAGQMFNSIGEIGGELMPAAHR